MTNQLNEGKAVSTGVIGVRLGCIKTESSGKDHQMQLWIHGRDGIYSYEIRQAYMPGGGLLRSCSLDSGKPELTYQAAVSQGTESMTKLLK